MHHDDDDDDDDDTMRRNACVNDNFCRRYRLQCRRRQAMQIDTSGSGLHESGINAALGNAGRFVDDSQYR